MQYEQILQKALNFFSKLNEKLDRHRVHLEQHWDIDHLCYRVDRLEKYEVLKESFLQFSNLLGESMVNGRPISTFELHKPLFFHRGQDWRIDLIELPAPKPGKIVQEGFEHLEVVVDLPFQDLLERYKDLPLDKGGLNKILNLELEITMGNENIKFHPMSLKSLIELESHKSVFEKLLESKILSIFKEFDPRLVGTFPLGVAVASSDLDVLLNVCETDSQRDWQTLKGLMHECFGLCSQFQIKEKIKNNQPSLVCSFLFEGLPVELFAQTEPTARQNANRHFLVEEKLLKFGGPDFKKKVMQLRSSGVKTEPAFAQALGLDGDPYEELLTIQKRDAKSFEKIVKESKGKSW